MTTSTCHAAAVVRRAALEIAAAKLDLEVRLAELALAELEAEAELLAAEAERLELYEETRAEIARLQALLPEYAAPLPPAPPVLVEVEAPAAAYSGEPEPEPEPEPESVRAAARVAATPAGVVAHAVATPAGDVTVVEYRPTTPARCRRELQTWLCQVISDYLAWLHDARNDLRTEELHRLLGELDQWETARLECGVTMPSDQAERDRLRRAVADALLIHWHADQHRPRV